MIFDIFESQSGNNIARAGGAGNGTKLQIREKLMHIFAIFVHIIHGFCRANSPNGCIFCSIGAFWFSLEAALFLTLYSSNSVSLMISDTVGCGNTCRLMVSTGMAVSIIMAAP